MIDKSVVQTYINNFRRRLAPFLRPGVGLKCLVHPVEVGGAILEFGIGPGIENDDVYQPQRQTIGRALSGIEQHAFGGNLEGFRFGGTNVILEKDKLIFIKDESSSEWSDAAAERDVSRVVSASPTSPRVPK